MNSNKQYFKFRQTSDDRFSLDLFNENWFEEYHWYYSNIKTYWCIKESIESQIKLLNISFQRWNIQKWNFLQVLKEKLWIDYEDDDSNLLDDLSDFLDEWDDKKENLFKFFQRISKNYLPEFECIVNDEYWSELTINLNDLYDYWFNWDFNLEEFSTIFNLTDESKNALKKLTEYEFFKWRIPQNQIKTIKDFIYVTQNEWVLFEMFSDNWRLSEDLDKKLFLKDVEDSPFIMKNDQFKLSDFYQKMNRSWELIKFNLNLTKFFDLELLERIEEIYLSTYSDKYEDLIKNHEILKRYCEKWESWYIEMMNDIKKFIADFKESFKDAVIKLFFHEYQFRDMSSFIKNWIKNWFFWDMNKELEESFDYLEEDIDNLEKNKIQWNLKKLSNDIFVKNKTQDNFWNKKTDIYINSKNYSFIIDNSRMNSFNELFSKLKNTYKQFFRIWNFENNWTNAKFLILNNQSSFIKNELLKSFIDFSEIYDYEKINWTIDDFKKSIEIFDKLKWEFASDNKIFINYLSSDYTFVKRV